MIDSLLFLLRSSISSLFDHCFERSYAFPSVLKYLAIVGVGATLTTLIISIVEVLLNRSQAKTVLRTKTAQFVDFFAILIFVILLS